MNEQPLTGTTIVVTRPERRAASLHLALAELGAEVIEFPVTALEPIAGADQQIRGAIRRLPDDGWVLLTSPTGAECVVGSGGVELSARCRIAAVGVATADVIRAAGGAVEVVAVDQRAESLADAVASSRPGSPAVALFVAAEGAGPALVDRLHTEGWRVEVVRAYRTVARLARPDLLDRVTAADVVVFAAGSAVAAFVELCGVDALPRHVVSIGPSTTMRGRELGVSTTVTASEHSVSGLVSAIVELLR